MAKRFIPSALLLVLLLAILSSSGCIGLLPNSGSSKQTTGGAAKISLAPASLSFGSVPVGSTASQSVTISNGGGSTLTVMQASPTAAGVTITGISFPLAIHAGKQASFTVVFSPKSAGALSGDIAVVSNLSNSPSTILLNGSGTPATALLTVSASSLNFGNVTIGKSSSSSVTFTNSGNTDVTVTNVGVSGASYSASGVSAGLILAPGQSAVLDSTFTPASAGSFPGNITVSSNASNSPDTISLTGAGTQVVSHTVSLTWSPSASAVTGYNVYRSEISGGPYSKLDSSIVTPTSYHDATVQSGLIYYYVVTSVSITSIESAYSTQAAALVPTP